MKRLVSKEATAAAGLIQNGLEQLRQRLYKEREIVDTNITPSERPKHTLGLGLVSRFSRTGNRRNFFSTVKKGSGTFTNAPNEVSTPLAADVGSSPAIEQSDSLSSAVQSFASTSSNVEDERRQDMVPLEHYQQRNIDRDWENILDAVKSAHEWEIRVLKEEHQAEKALSEEKHNRQIDLLTQEHVNTIEQKDRNAEQLNKSITEKEAMLVEKNTTIRELSTGNRQMTGRHDGLWKGAMACLEWMKSAKRELRNHEEIQKSSYVERVNLEGALESSETERNSLKQVLADQENIIKNAYTEQVNLKIELKTSVEKGVGLEQLLANHEKIMENAHIERVKLENDLSNSFLEKINLEQLLAEANDTIKEGKSRLLRLEVEWKRDSAQLQQATALLEEGTAPAEFGRMMRRLRDSEEENSWLSGEVQQRIQHAQYLHGRKTLYDNELSKLYAEHDSMVQASIQRFQTMEHHVRNLTGKLLAVEKQLKEATVAKKALTEELNRERQRPKMGSSTSYQQTSPWGTRTATDAHNEQLSGHTRVFGPPRPSRFNFGGATPLQNRSPNVGPIAKPAPSQESKSTLEDAMNPESLPAGARAPTRFGARQRSKFTFGESNRPHAS